MYVIFADTDSDVTPSIAAEYGYNLISMPYSIKEKEIYIRCYNKDWQIIREVI